MSSDVSRNGTSLDGPPLSDAYNPASDLTKLADLGKALDRFEIALPDIAKAGAISKQHVTSLTKISKKLHHALAEVIYAYTTSKLS